VHVPCSRYAPSRGDLPATREIRITDNLRNSTDSNPTRGALGTDHAWYRNGDVVLLLDRQEAAASWPAGGPLA
jgi:hypothetical protein